MAVANEIDAAAQVGSGHHDASADHAEAMRIVVIGPAPPLRGGIAQHTAGMAAALRARGHRVGVISYRRLYPRALFPGRSELAPARPSERGAALDALGPLTCGGAMLDTLAPATWMRVRRVLHAQRPALIVMQWWHPIAAPALAYVAGGARCSIAVVCHNALPHESFPAASVLARLVLARARLAVCHSRAVADQIARLAPGIARAHAAMPVLISPTIANGRETDAAEAARGCSCLRVVFAGVVRPYKGVDVLLEAWRRARVPVRATLTIAGESYLGAGSLERMVADCGERSLTIRLIDRYLPDDELWASLRTAGVVVLPYRRASQSGIVPLARAAGATIIASDAGGLAETLGGDTRHRVVPAGDAGALARALEDALSDASARCACSHAAGTLERGNALRHAVSSVTSGVPIAFEHETAARAEEAAASWTALTAVLERAASLAP